MKAKAEDMCPLLNILIISLVLASILKGLKSGGGKTCVFLSDLPDKDNLFPSVGKHETYFDVTCKISILKSLCFFSSDTNRRSRGRKDLRLKPLLTSEHRLVYNRHVFQETSFPNQAVHVSSTTDKKKLRLNLKRKE